MYIFRRLGWTALVSIVCVLASWAQDAPKLTAEEILEKHIEATGGRERYAAVKTMMVKSEVTGDLNPTLLLSTMPVRINQTGVTESYSAAPNRRLTVTEYAGRREIDASGCDGEHAWYAVNGVGVRQETKGALFESFCAPLFEFPLNWQKTATRVETRGTKDVKGRKMVVVRFWHGGNYTDDFFDAQSYFLLQEQNVHKTSFATVKVIRTYSDFRTIEGGLIFPFRLDQEFDVTPASTAVPMRSASRKVLVIKVNIPLDPAIFQAPTQHK